MPDIKFSQLTITTSAESADLIPIVDRSNPLMSENGSNAAISVGDLSDSLFDGLGDGALSSTKIQENPSFFGNVTLPTTTSIGSVSGTELSFLSGLRGNIQTQLDNPTLSGTLTLGPGTLASPPLKINAGTNTTLPAAGALEFDGSKLYITDSTPTRHALATEAFVTSAITETYNNILEIEDDSFAVNSTHYNTYIRLSNTSGTTIDLPSLDSTPTGTTIIFRRTTTAGALTLTAGIGVTINDSDASAILPGKIFTLKYIDTDTWDFI